MFQSVIKIQDFNRAGEVEPAQFPNPGGSVADENDFLRPAQAPAAGFGSNAQTKGLGRLEAADISGGSKIAFGPAFLIAAGLGEDSAQFDFAGFGRAVGLLAFAPGQFVRHHRHAGAIDFRVQYREGLELRALARFELGGYLRGGAVDQALNLPSFDLD